LIRVDDRLKFLQGESISLKHQLDRVFVQLDFVLLEQIDELVNVQRARPVLVELPKNSFDDFILSYFLVTHQVLLLHEGKVLRLLGRLLSCSWLFEFVKLDFLLQPFLHVVTFKRATLV